MFSVGSLSFEMFLPVLGYNHRYFNLLQNKQFIPRLLNWVQSHRVVAVVVHRQTYVTDLTWY